jgi:hypothetical protein
MRKLINVALATALSATAAAVAVEPAFAINPRSPWVNNHPLDRDYGSYPYYRDRDYRYAYRAPYAVAPYPYAYYDDDYYYRHRYHPYRGYYYGPAGAAAALFGTVAGAIADEIDD